MFRRLLKQLHGDHWVTFSKIVRLLICLLGMGGCLEGWRPILWLWWRNDAVRTPCFLLSHKFPSLSCINRTCRSLFQSARLSIRTDDFSCYCGSPRGNIKLWRLIQYGSPCYWKGNWFESRGTGGSQKYLQEWQQYVWIIHEGGCLEKFRYFWIKSQWIESNVLVWLWLGIVCSCHTCRRREAQDHPMSSLWIIRKHG